MIGFINKKIWVLFYGEIRFSGDFRLKTGAFWPHEPLLAFTKQLIVVDYQIITRKLMYIRNIQVISQKLLSVLWQTVTAIAK